MIEFDWSRAGDSQARGSAIVTRVAFAHPANPYAVKALEGLLGIWETETRGQTWDAIEVTPGGVVVRSRTDPSLDVAHLKTYLTDAAKNANRDAAERRSKREAAVKAANNSQQRATKEAERIARELGGQ